MAKQVQKIFGSGNGGRLPRGASLGMKLLGAAVLVGGGISQSVYTGEHTVQQHLICLNS